jgi:hypothetical protein
MSLLDFSWGEPIKLRMKDIQVVFAGKAFSVLYK